MLKRLHVRNFTVFADAEFEFSLGLNIIVGTNGTGKSHVLKLGYAVEAAAAAVGRAQSSIKQDFDSLGYPLAWTVSLYGLKNIFQAEQSGHLIRRGVEGNGAAVEAVFHLPSQGSLKFEISPADDKEKRPSSIKVSEGETPHFGTKRVAEPVFIPAKEILTMMPDIVGLSDNYPDLFDTTYISLARKLTIRPLTQLPAAAQPVIDALGVVMGGSIQAENGRFYLQPQQGVAYEIGLVAEGLRKLGTLAYLLANGSLTKETTLFWDEPEANLNPALLRELASLLTLLVSQGFQIILATHSLFLLKELHILSYRAKDSAVHYFGLFTGPEGDTRVETTDDLELLQHITALDAELAQTFDFEETLDQDDASNTRG